MINDRPKHLLADPSFTSRPSAPYSLNWGTVPELVRASVMDLGGVQPVTRDMITVAGGTIFDNPSPAEIDYFRERKTTFQLVSLIASVVDGGEVDGVRQVRPFALSLLPASKRDAVEIFSIDEVASLKGSENFQDMQPCYLGYDPFSGEWGLYGPASTVLTTRNGYLDEIGLVVEMFYLATDFDPEDVLTVDIGFPSGKTWEKYRNKRNALLFSPFKRVAARRIWGAETPIELFLLQELARHGLHPQLQILFMRDGRSFPSWYNFWQDMEFRHKPDLLTEADMYFPDQRVAVFCDGAHHERRPQQLKDAAITEALGAMGISSVRVSGRLINNDLATAGEEVLRALR